MNVFELLLIAVGLSMDAFAVSVCKGLANKKVTWRDGLLVGLWFGGFQALMPLLGYLLGATFEQHIAAWDHWIAFGLLGIIGLKMIKDSFEDGEADGSLSASIMFPLAVASSIDALATGVTFAFFALREYLGRSLAHRVHHVFPVGLWAESRWSGWPKTKCFGRTLRRHYFNWNWDKNLNRTPVFLIEQSPRSHIIQSLGGCYLER